MKFLPFVLLLSLANSAYSQHKPADPQSKSLIKSLGDFSSITGKKFGKFTGASTANILYSDSSLENKVTLVTFWFAACKPCVTEFTDLNAICEKYKDNPGFQLLAFTFDSTASAMETARIYGLRYTIIPLTKSLCTTLSFSKGYPTNMIVGKDGTILYAGGGMDIYENDKYFQSVITPKIDSALLTLNH